MTRLGPGPGLAPPGGPLGTAVFEQGRRHGADVARAHTASDGGITMAARERHAVVGGRRAVERLAAADGGAPTPGVVLGAQGSG